MTALHGLFLATVAVASAVGDRVVPFEYPLFKQCDTRWGSDIIETKTVCTVGCLMSSTSMALNGSGVRVGENGTNPGSLNAWLRANGGYTSGDDFIESALPKLDPSRVSWPKDAMHTTNDLSVETVRSYLSASPPRVVIANVMKGRHFVLVVGWHDGDNDTLLVNDPGFDRGNYSYSSDVVGWRIFDMQGPRVPTAVASAAPVLNLFPTDAECNDGTKSGFYFRESSGSDPSSSPWVLFLEGGGWCYDKKSCDLRKDFAPDLMSSKAWKSTLDKSTGIFSQDCSDNPVFCEANHVYLRYCTSDGWSGNATSSDIGFSFMGARVIRDVIDRLDLDPSFAFDRKTSKVLFTGCSAGGRGAMFNADRVRGEFGVVNTRALFDSGWWLDIEPLSSTTTSLGAQARAVYTLAKSEINSDCVSAQTTGEEWRCFFANTSMPFVKTPSISQAFQYDSFQLGVDTATKPPYSADAAQYATHFRNTMRTTFTDALVAPHVVFSPACYDHCSVESNRYSTTRVNGTQTSLAGLIAEWWTQEPGTVPRVLADDCEGFSCGVGC